MHGIIVIRHNYVEVEVVVIIMVTELIEEVIQQVDITIVNNNGTEQMVVPVDTCGVMIVNRVVVLAVMIVINHKIQVVTAIVKQIQVGGTIRHEK